MIWVFDVKAFNPISKIDVTRVETPEDYLNLKSKFIIDKFSTSAKARIVVSRRQYLEAAAEEAKKAFFENTQIGDEYRGNGKKALHLSVLLSTWAVSTGCYISTI